MQFHRNELFLLYNPETSKGRQTKALAKTICANINELNVMHERLGPTYWKEVVTMLGLEPKELLDRSQPDYQAKVAGKALTMTGWLDVLMHYPQLLQAPVAIYNGKAVLCHTPTDLFKLGVKAKETLATEKALPHLRHPL
jgi:arsenate reductase (glutaredoxin)